MDILLEIAVLINILMFLHRAAAGLSADDLGKAAAGRRTRVAPPPHPDLANAMAGQLDDVKVVAANRQAHRAVETKRASVGISQDVDQAAGGIEHLHDAEGAIGRPDVAVIVAGHALGPVEPPQVHPVGCDARPRGAVRPEDGESGVDHVGGEYRAVRSEVDLKRVSQLSERLAAAAEPDR